MNDPNSVLAMVQRRVEKLPPDFPEVLTAPIAGAEINFLVEPEAAVNDGIAAVVEVRFHDNDLPEVVPIPDEIKDLDELRFLWAILCEFHADIVSTAGVSTDNKLCLTVMDTHNCWELSCPIIRVAGSYLLGDWRIEDHQRVDEDE